MDNEWTVVIGKFTVTDDIYFNNKRVANASHRWYFELKKDYYACIKEIDSQTIRMLTYVKCSNK